MEGDARFGNERAGADEDRSGDRDSKIKERASAVLEGMGLTVSDAVRILRTRTANEGGAAVYGWPEFGGARRVVSGEGAGGARGFAACGAGC